MVTREGIIAVYIVANRRHGTLYIGVTGDLARRAYEHREGAIPGFSKTHGCTRLVWWKPCETMLEAIAAEKTMKHWRRDWKTNLIERENPLWDDLYGNWM